VAAAPLTIQAATAAAAAAGTARIAMFVDFRICYKFVRFLLRQEIGVNSSRNKD
jgi:hypothetical protein